MKPVSRFHPVAMKPVSRIRISRQCKSYCGRRQTMRERWNLGWLFHYGDEPGADFMGWDDAAWERVTLPHDWAVSFPFDRKNASGTGYLPVEQPGIGSILY